MYIQFYFWLGFTMRSNNYFNFPLGWIMYYVLCRQNVWLEVLHCLWTAHCCMVSQLECKTRCVVTVLCCYLWPLQITSSLWDFSYSFVSSTVQCWYYFCLFFSWPSCTPRTEFWRKKSMTWWDAARRIRYCLACLTFAQTPNTPLLNSSDCGRIRCCAVCLIFAQTPNSPL